MSAGPAIREEQAGIGDRKKALLTLPLIAVILAVGNLVGTALALAWIFVTRTAWRDVGLAIPRRWPSELGLGVLCGFVLKLLSKAVLMPLLGANPINTAYADLASNARALPGILLLVIVVGGFGEELIWRGLLFERLQRIFGTHAGVRTAIVLGTAVLFGIAHYVDQGRDGTLQATITGIAFGGAYMLTGSLWPVMAAHAAYDVTAVLLIYFGAESAVAHWFF